MSRTPKITKCGVKSGKILPYTLQDHYWKLPAMRTKTYSGMNLSLVFDALSEFTNRCILADGNYWMKNGIGDHWVKKETIGLARKESMNLWLNQPIGPTPIEIDDDFLKAFFDGTTDIPEVDARGITRLVKHQIGSCPQLENQVVIPFMGPFLLYKNKKLLNTWVDNGIQSDFSNLRFAKPVIRLIYRSLCNGLELDPDPLKEMDMLVEQILSNSYTCQDFKFLINWLAVLVQLPGANLLTNIFLCGEQEGVGKGTLVTLMMNILGSNIVTKLNTSDIMRGWNDHLLGKVLVEVNELKPETTIKQGWGPERWATWIKEYSIEEEVSISGRNRSPQTALNIGNYIFTTNDENPIYLDRSDRRNYLIKTTDDPQWVEYAIQINTQVANPHAKELASGFRWLLECVDIDMSFVNKAHINQFKKELIEQSIDVVERWISEDVTIPQGTWERSREVLFTKFKNWAKLSSPRDADMSETSWGKKMTKLGRLGVEKRKTVTGIEYIIGTPPVTHALDKIKIGSAISTAIQEINTEIDLSLEIKTEIVERVERKSLAAIRAKLLETEQNEYDQNA